MITDAKKVLDENGQALFEFVFFIPLFVMLMIILISLGNSINGSINQQKITRSYFFSRIKNNSLMPIKSPEQKGWRSFGMFFIGWNERRINNQPIQPCYELKTPFEGETECVAYNETSSSFIRVGTVFGACGASYIKSQGLNEIFKAPIGTNINFASSADGCLIK